jgi:hypothetical protein
VPRVEPDQLDIFNLDDVVWIAAAPVGLPNYDFPFQTFFACRRPWQRPAKLQAIGRFGVTTNYRDLFEQLAEQGVFLIHSPEQYLMASELTHWYPLLSDLTPRSIWFSEPPTIAEIKRSLEFPIFMKGSRQTSKHQAHLSILHTASDYERAIQHYKTDPILHWQDLVCRQFIELRPVPARQTDVISPSFEFRTFWWRGQCIGAGAYWSAFVDYDWNETEKVAALAVAEEAASRLRLPFLVIDVAQTKSGEWLVIECNDAQESGYAGISPIALWQKLIALERESQGESAT